MRFEVGDQVRFILTAKNRYTEFGRRQAGKVFEIYRTRISHGHPVYYMYELGTNLSWIASEVQLERVPWNERR
jgi:hypothetical protein